MVRHLLGEGSNDNQDMSKKMTNEVLTGVEMRYMEIAKHTLGASLDEVSYRELRAKGTWELVRDKLLNPADRSSLDSKDPAQLQVETFFPHLIEPELCLERWRMLIGKQDS